MNYINPPADMPKNMMHNTFYSHVLSHEIGYNIYLPPEYEKDGERYPVVYHIHGFKGNESSEIWTSEQAYVSRDVITVFINSISSKSEYFGALLEIESILIGEILPHVDERYKTNAICENRMLSGFSMGGAMAFYYAVKHPELFGSVTSYAGTFHHQYQEDYDGVGKPPEAAPELLEKMMREKRYLKESNILYLVGQNADKIRGNLHISLHIGTEDILFCDSEIMHLYLCSLDIPHEYEKFTGAEHELSKIL